MLRIGVISNPYSRLTKRHDDYNMRLWYALGNHGQFEITTTRAELDRVAQDFCARGINHVAILGGDGSIVLTLTALEKAYGPDHLPRILLLGGGTVNVLAGNLGISNRPIWNLKHYIALLQRQAPLRRQSFATLRVNEQLGFLFSFGAGSSFLVEFYRNKSSSWGSFLFLLRAGADAISGGRLGGLSTRIVQPCFTSISAESGAPFAAGEMIPVTLAIASTIPRVSWRIPLFRRVSANGRAIEYLISSLSAFELAAATTRVILGREPPRKGTSRGLTRSLSFSFDKPAIYTIDGELFAADDREIKIDMGPRFLFCSPYETIESGGNFIG